MFVINLSARGIFKVAGVFFMTANTSQFSSDMYVIVSEYICDVMLELCLYLLDCITCIMYVLACDLDILVGTLCFPSILINCLLLMTFHQTSTCTYHNAPVLLRARHSNTTYRLSVLTLSG